MLLNKRQPIKMKMTKEVMEKETMIH